MTGSQFSITMLACFFLFSSKECQDFFLLSASDWQKMGSKNRRKNIWMYNIYMHNSLPTGYNIHAECLFRKSWISNLLFLWFLISIVLCIFSDVKRNWGEYRKVTSSNMSRLEAHAGFFRLLMKGNFDPYLLWPFDKKLIS
jgi:hypothetical protein